MPFLLFRMSLFCLLVLCGIASTAQQPPGGTLPLNPVYHGKAIAIEKEAIQKKDTVLLAEAYYQYYKSFSAAGDYKNAHAYFMKSFEIQEKRGDTYELGRLYFYLSAMAISMSHYEDALKHIRKSLAIAQKIQSDIGFIRAYKSLAEIHKQNWKTPQHPNWPQARLDSAQFYYQKLLQIAQKINNSEALAEAYEGLGDIQKARNSPKAIGYFEACHSLFVNKVKSKSGTVSVSISLLSVYTYFKKYDQAQKLVQKVEAMIDTVYINTKMYSNLQKELILLYKATRNWKKALEHSEKLNKIEHKELMDDREGAISRLNIEYETQKKEAQLKSQQQEITLRAENERNQQIFLLITFALLLVAVGATAAFYRLYRKNQRISRQNEELVKEQNHRVKNNLQVVSSLLNLQARQLPDAAAKRAVTDSQLRIQSMAILHRRLYDGEELAKVNLPEFIQELVKGVLKTFGYQSITPMFAIDRIHLHADKAVPLGLIINELVTNACKYAFPCTDAPTLEISCQQKDNKLQLIVADNGLGWNEPFDRGVVISKKSFGMKLIKSQAEQLNAVYDFEQERGTIFRMMFKI